MTDAITIHQLTKTYLSGTVALKGITFSIKAGEFFALLGPNGAGKTTAINIITGLANKTGGDALLFGKDVVKDYREARALVGLVPQEFNVDQFEKVSKVLYFNGGYFGLSRPERFNRIGRLLKDLSLEEKRDTKFRELSGGMKRKLLIARALIHDPPILILDEPTAGVDVETRRFLWDYFRQLNRQGKTILLTTHYIEEAEELCQRIAVINKGEIVALDKKQNLLALLERETMTLHLKRKIGRIPKQLQKYHPQEQDAIITIEYNPQKEEAQEILDAIQAAKLPLLKIETSRTTLEDVFLHLTKK